MIDAEKAALGKWLRRWVRVETDRPLTNAELERALQRIDGVVFHGYVVSAVGKNAQGETLWSVRRVHASH